MRRLLFSTLSVLAVLAAAACGDSLTEPAEPEVQPPPISADHTPSMSGVVERFFAVGGGGPPPIYDSDTNLSSSFGFDVAGFCGAGGPGVADPIPYFDAVSHISLVHAPGQGGLIRIRGEGSLYIWEGVVATLVDACATPPLGSGWAKNTYTENATSPQNAGPNIANTFHFSATGAVVTADGIKQAVTKVAGLVKNGMLQALDFTIKLSN